MLKGIPLHTLRNATFFNVLICFVGITAHGATPSESILTPECIVPSSRDRPRVRRNFLRVYKDLLFAFIAYEVHDFFHIAPTVPAYSFLQDYPITPGEALDELLVMTKSDYFLSLQQDDPLKKLGNHGLTGPPPEKRAQVMKYVEAADFLFLEDTCLPVMTACRMMYDLSYRLSSSPRDPDIGDCMDFLRKINLRKTKYQDGATTEELKAFEAIHSCLVASNMPYPAGL